MTPDIEEHSGRLTKVLSKEGVLSFDLDKLSIYFYGLVPSNTELTHPAVVAQVEDTIAEHYTLKTKEGQTIKTTMERFNRIRR
jgi:hypothetical protein